MKTLAISAVLITCVCGRSELRAQSAKPVSAEDKAVLRRAFDGYDKDKNGIVTPEEFPGDRILFREMDKDRNRAATFAEYESSALASRLLESLREDRSEPRKRVGAGDLARKRLAWITRFDKNRDGKITRQEWTGSPASFRSLDVDGNGRIDKKDRARVVAEAEVLDKARARLPEVRVMLPAPAAALEMFDTNKDSSIDEKEAAKTPLRTLFRYADLDRDGKLIRQELDRLVKEVNMAVRRRNQGYASRAPTIPFRAWDKNKDGRLDTKEFKAEKYLFRAIDANRDAGVTEDEVLRYKRAVEGSNFLEKFDLDGDNKVTREEFAGTRAAFDRADRNGDGVISSRDR